MNLWLWTVISTVAIVIVAMPLKNVPHFRNGKLASTHTNKPRRKEEQPKGKTGQIWMNVKGSIRTLYNRALRIMAKLFDDKERRYEIIIPRMRRRWKEMKKQLTAIRQAIHENPRGRYLAALYVNIAVFVIGYAILFIYNIHCYFRYQRVWAEDGKPVFKPDHVFDGLKSPKILPSVIKKAAMSAARRAHMELLSSPTETILEEDEELARTEVTVESAAKKSQASGSSKITELGNRKSPQRQGKDLRERSLAMLEEFSDSSYRSSLDTSTISFLRHRSYRTSEMESEQIFSSNDSEEALPVDYCEPAKSQSTDEHLTMPFFGNDLTDEEFLELAGSHAAITNSQGSSGRAHLTDDRYEGIERSGPINDDGNAAIDIDLDDENRQLDAV